MQVDKTEKLNKCFSKTFSDLFINESLTSYKSQSSNLSRDHYKVLQFHGSFNPVMIKYTEPYFVLKAISIILFALAFKSSVAYFNVIS